MEISTLVNLLEYLNTHDKNDKTYQYIIESLIPNKIDYRLDTNDNHTAQFVPNTRTIEVNMNKIDEWLNYNTEYLSERFNISDKPLLSNYLILNMFIHEIQHSKQYLISTGELESYQILKEGYNYIFKLMQAQGIENVPIVGFFSKVARLTKLVLYNRKHDSYVLERDANLESFHLLRKLAKEINDKNLKKSFALYESNILRLGYEDTCDGALKQTFYELGMKSEYDKLPKNEEIDYQDRIRYGLEIDEEKSIKL